MIELKASTLSALLSGATCATDNTKHAPEFARVINLRLEGGELRAAATDRYLMALGTVTGCDPTLSGNAYLMPDTVKAILTMLKPLKDNSITIAYDNGLVIAGNTFKHDPISYPDLDKVIPTEFAGLDSNQIIIDPKVLGRACKVTGELIRWQFAGEFKPMLGTANDNGIAWQLIVMPCRVR
jgi:DNA polymerase III sliding clamp (beta) subunit (PCNA family)